MKEQLVAITYIAGESQGAELALAVAGWRKHFKCPHKLIVVGDKPPVDVKVDGWLEVKRIPEKEGEYRPHLDICHKLETICYMYGDKYPGFIWASDDCYAVNNFTLSDVKAPKYQEEEMPSKGEDHFNPWWRNLVKTRKLCEKEGLGVVNWVTHLPIYFDIRLLILTIWKYSLTEKSYVVENLYFNKYLQDGKAEKLSENDRWKLSVFYSPLYRPRFYDALANKIWVCNSVNGWSDALEEELRRHYKL